MAIRAVTKVALAAIMATVLLGACATIRRSQAHQTEDLLAAAGFTMHVSHEAARTSAP